MSKFTNLTISMGLALGFINAVSASAETAGVDTRRFTLNEVEISLETKLQTEANGDNVIVWTWDL